MIQIGSEILIEFILNTVVIVILVTILSVFIFHKIKGRLIPYYLLYTSIFSILSVIAYLIMLITLKPKFRQSYNYTFSSFFLIIAFFSYISIMNLFHIINTHLRESFLCSDLPLYV